MKPGLGTFHMVLLFTNKVGPCGKLPPEGQLARQKYSGLVRKK